MIKRPSFGLFWGEYIKGQGYYEWKRNWVPAHLQNKLPTLFQVNTVESGK